MVYDLSKAYNSVITGSWEAFLRLMVWRFGKTEAEWTVYAYRVMAFGDSVSATLLELAKDMVAEHGRVKSSR